MLFKNLSQAAEKLPKNKPTHLAIGFFDGVHIGHQALLKNIISKANTTNGISVALTFWPHPNTILSKNTNIHILTRPAEKYKKITSVP